MEQGSISKAEVAKCPDCGASNSSLSFYTLEIWNAGMVEEGFKFRCFRCGKKYKKVTRYYKHDWVTDMINKKRLKFTRYQHNNPPVELLKIIENLLHHNEKNEIGHIPRAKIHSQFVAGNFLLAIYTPEKRVVGFLSIYQRKDQIMKFTHMMVHKDFRRLGIGTQLLKLGVKEAIHDSMIEIHFKARRDAQLTEYYIQRGFSVCKFNPRYWRTRHADEYVFFEKILKRTKCRGINNVR